MMEFNVMIVIGIVVIGIVMSETYGKIGLTVKDGNLLAEATSTVIITQQQPNAEEQYCQEACLKKVSFRYARLCLIS